MTKIPITPFTITKTDTITDISINSTSIILNTSLSVNYSLINDKGQLVKSNSIILIGSTFSAWKAADDNYIITQILSNE